LRVDDDSITEDLEQHLVDGSTLGVGPSRSILLHVAAGRTRRASIAAAAVSTIVASIVAAAAGMGRMHQGEYIRRWVAHSIQTGRRTVPEINKL
jgi:hypothetical protein